LSFKHPFPAGQNLVYQPQQARVVELASQGLAQDFVVDGRKELAHVALERVAEAPCKSLATVQCAMCPFTDPVGIAVADKRTLKARLDHVAQRVVHHPVAKRSGRDEAALGFVDEKAGVWAGLIGLGL
jgi:hypothetical protein